MSFREAYVQYLTTYEDRMVHAMEEATEYEDDMVEVVRGLFSELKSEENVNDVVEGANQIDSRTKHLIELEMRYYPAAGDSLEDDLDEAQEIKDSIEEKIPFGDKLSGILGDLNELTSIVGLALPLL